MSEDEVFIIEEDDLEEGEITDDSDSEIEVIMPIKPKKLPKRYLHDKKVSNEKHKKDCKYAYHSNHKVKDWNKSTLSNGVHKKHKSSCPLQHQKSLKEKPVPKKHAISPNLTKPLNMHNPTLKSAFKNFTSPPRLVSQKTSPGNEQDFDNEDSYPELLLAYKKCREQLSHKRRSSDFDYRDEHSASKKPTRHSFNDSSSLPKSSKKQSLNEKISPTKNVSPLLNDKITDITNDNQQPLIENTPVPQAMHVQHVQETSSPIVEEESEDEEELRRIALATCVKRTLARQTAAVSSNSVNNSPIYSLSNQSSVTLIVNGNNNSSDNHDVVDMDLDDGNFIQVVDNNLFVIDNKPVMPPSEFNQYMFYGEPYLVHSNLPAENPLPPKQEQLLSSSIAQLNEEFEEAILRAEVIASMNLKKIAVPSSCVPEKSPELTNTMECLSPQNQFHKPAVYSKGHSFNNNLIKIAVPSSCVPEKSPEPTNTMECLSPQDQFHKAAVYSKGHSFNAFEANIKKPEVVKLSNCKFPNSKKVPAPKPRNINATQNRLIITLNNDSSSEESDAAEDLFKLNKQDNVVASIDALISNARQKSDIKANGTNLNNVSCLSKAQQEEYKKLRNRLAEMETMEKEPVETEPIIPQVVKEKISAEHQSMNFLTNTITVAKEKLDKEVDALTNTEKEVLNKKNMYISSKLKFQHLQEQLHAAKLIKTENLKAWKVYEAKLANANSIVTKQKALIALLETEFNNRRLQLEQNSSSPLIQ